MSSTGFRVIKADRAVPRGALLPGLRREAIGPAAAPAIRLDPAARSAEETLLAEARRRAAALEERAAGLLAEAEEAARTRREQAEAEAAAIVAAAERSAAEIRARAREEGLVEGRRRGREEGLAATLEEAEEIRAAARRDAEEVLAAARAEAERIAAEARSRWEQRLAELEPDLIRLALAIARRVLREEIRQRPEAIAAMVAAAVEKVRGGGEPRLRVNPSDAERLALSGSVPAGVAIVPDGSLAPGEFVAESDHGMVDGRLGAQIAQVAAALGVEVPDQ